MDQAKLDEACTKMDALVKRFDAWSPEAREAAAEARRKGGKGEERKRSGFGTKSMRTLDEKHQRELKPLLDARDKEKHHSPEWEKAQKAVYGLMDKQTKEMLDLQSKIEKGEAE